MKYTFKRKIYYELQENFETQCNIFLLGPRKCGKTVCLQQIANDYPNAKYYNMKILSQLQMDDVFLKIHQSIESNESIIYLLDEITYADFPEREINSIAVMFSEYDNHNTRIVYTGSQSAALEAWASRAFCGNAALIYVDFLQYDEWLQYRGLTEISSKTYSEFLYTVRDFYHLHSLREYLQGCLEETIVSNMKTDNIILGNDCSLLDVDILLDVCYATLFTLHNHVSSNKFFPKNKLNTDIAYYFRDVCRQLGNFELTRRITDSFIGHYNNLKSRDLTSLKQAFGFLYRIGLITITPVSDDFENVQNVLQDLISEESSINYKSELFKTFNMCIKYPMFYIAILQDILKEEMPAQLPTLLLGSIVECHVRGLLAENRNFEFQATIFDDLQHPITKEIDYVDLSKSIAIEITVSNKRSDEHNFEILPDYFTCIMLTRDIMKSYSHYIEIPYYQFIHDISALVDPIKTWTQSDISSQPEKISF